MMGNEAELTDAREAAGERAFMQRVLVDSTATGSALTAVQHGCLLRWHAQGWWTRDGMSLSNGHLTADGRTAQHDAVRGQS